MIADYCGDSVAAVVLPYNSCFKSYHEISDSFSRYEILRYQKRLPKVRPILPKLIVAPFPEKQRGTD